MSTLENYAHGQLCWVDLMSKDIAQAKAFYSKVFGWEVVDQDTQGGPPYVIFQQDGHQLCGLGQMTDEMKASGMPAFWNSYINVDDLEAATSKATELGGTVTMPAMQVLDAGKMAGIQDPSGAHVFFWEAINHKGAGLVNVAGTWVWNEIMTHDPDAAIKFFSDLFSWTFEKEEGSPSDYWTFKNGDRLNGGMLGMTKENFGDMPPAWVTYFNVASMEASLEAIQFAGGQVWNGPFPSSVGDIAVVADDQGAMFNVIQMSVPPDE